MKVKVGNIEYDNEVNGENHWDFKILPIKKEEVKHTHKDPIPLPVIEEIENESKQRYRDCIKSSILETTELLLNLSKQTN